MRGQVRQKEVKEKGKCKEVARAWTRGSVGRKQSENINSE